MLQCLSYLGTDKHAVLFPNSRGKALSDTAMRKYLQEDMGQIGLTVHGFRSTVRDWAAEQIPFAREVAEFSLAHTLRDKVQAAYQRGDMPERRRKLMEMWSDFCTLGATSTGKVVPLRKSASH